MSLNGYPEPDRKAVEAIVGKMGELAALPHVVFKVVEAAGSADAPAAAVERAVVLDPGFAARLLAEANSPAYSSGVRVSSIREATMRLGFGTVRNLALAVGTFDLFVGRTDAESLRRRGWWKLSLDAAMAAKWLAHRTRAAKPDDAYTAGLLHLVGRTVLDRCGGVPYTRVHDLAKAKGISDAEAEWAVYGAHGGHIGEAAGAKWGFPGAMALAMNAVDAPAVADPLRAVVALAAAMARGDGAENFPRWALETVGVPPEEVPTLLSEAAGAISAAQDRLAA